MITPMWETKEVIENGTIIEVLRCPYCGKELAERTVAGSAYMVHWVKDCEHFKWVEIGNACTPYSPHYDPEICGNTEELFEKAVTKLENGTTIYLLLQK